MLPFAPGIAQGFQRIHRLPGLADEQRQAILRQWGFTIA